MIKFLNDLDYLLDSGFLNRFLIIALISNIGGIDTWWRFL